RRIGGGGVEHPGSARLTQRGTGGPTGAVRRQRVFHHARALLLLADAVDARAELEEVIRVLQPVASGPRESAQPPDGAESTARGRDWGNAAHRCRRAARGRRSSASGSGATRKAKRQGAEPDGERGG